MTNDLKVFINRSNAKIKITNKYRTFVPTNIFYHDVNTCKITP